MAATILGCAPSMAEGSSKTKIAIPSVDNRAFVYNGEIQAYDIAPDLLYSVYGSTHKAAGEYKVTVSINDPETYEWEDGTVEDKIYDFVIKRVKVEIPAADTSHFVYTGTQHTYAIAETDKYSVDGNRKTNAGNHNVTVYLNDPINYEWTDATTEDKIYNFAISKIPVAIPAADTTKFTYNGMVAVYNIAPNVLYSVSGNIMTKAGRHIVNVTLSDPINYEWADGGSTTKTYNFDIAKAPVELPTAVKDSFAFDGEAKIFEVVPNDKYTVGVSNSTASQVGVYKRTVFINDSENYIWADNTTDTKSVSFVITEGIVKIPQVSDINFTGSTISLVPESPAYKVENGKVTNAGEYTVNLTLNPGYIWEDGTKSVKTLSVKVNSILVKKPTVNSVEVSYDSTVYAVKVPESIAYTITGSAVGIEPGTYTTVVTLNPNFMWSDSTTEAITYYLKISKVKVAIPSADSSTFFYNQEEQTYPIEENANYTVEGNNQTEIGVYDIVVALNDTAHYEWTDGTSDPKHYQFEIEEYNDFRLNSASTSASTTPGNDLTIGIDANGKVQYYKVSSSLMPELKDSLFKFNNELQAIKLPTPANAVPGKYIMNITLISGKIDTTFTVDVAINYSASNIIVCWNDVVAVDHSKIQSTTYQWYKDGELIPGATSAYYCDKNGLSGYYMCKIDGDISVGPAYLSFGRPVSLTAYGSTGKIVASVLGSTTAKVFLMSVGGMVTDSQIAAPEMTFTVDPGIYVLVLEGTDQSIKVVVK